MKRERVKVCGAKKIGDPATTCSLPLGHRGACSWSWLRNVNKPLHHDHSVTRDEMEKQKPTRN